LFRVLVILQVRDFELLDSFEGRAAEIMADYEGQIAAAFETARNADGSGEEVHLLEFKSRQHFVGYRQDNRHVELKELREKSISSTEIKEQIAWKVYSNCNHSIQPQSSSQPDQNDQC
jgi:uncharacterized protein (DUF1330 family)